MIENQKVHCPFCITTWICDGPHVTTVEERINLGKYMYHSKQDYIFNALDEVKKYGLENELDLQELSDRIKERINKRDR